MSEGNEESEEIVNAKIRYCRARQRVDQVWERGQVSGYTYKENGVSGRYMLDQAREELHAARHALQDLGVEYQKENGDALPWVAEVERTMWKK